MKSLSQNSNEPLTSRMGLKGGGHGWPRSLEFWDRLEVCTESFWKTIRAYILHIDDTIPVPGSKSAFRGLYQLQRLSSQEHDLLCETIDRRNRFSHLYDEPESLQIYAKIPEDLRLIREIVLRLQKTPPTSSSSPSR